MAETNCQTILVKKEDGLTTVTFNRPDKRNVMNPQLHRDMYRVLNELRYDKDTWVIVLTGAAKLLRRAGHGAISCRVGLDAGESARRNPTHFQSLPVERKLSVIRTTALFV